MIRKVWKYPLKVIGGEQRLMIPQDGKVVHVDKQDNAPVLWVEVYPNDPKEERVFRIHGTGHGIETFWNHVGTCLFPPYVWHIYEWEVN